jgi:hypothetical protein
MALCEGKADRYLGGMMRATLAGAAVLIVCAALTACADNTGSIDDMGHNGYDRMTCEDFKDLAMDVEYEMLSQAEGAQRAKALGAEAGHAADAAVKQAASQYVTAFLAGDREKRDATIKPFMQACHW